MCSQSGRDVRVWPVPHLDWLLSQQLSSHYHPDCERAYTHSLSDLISDNYGGGCLYKNIQQTRQESLEEDKMQTDGQEDIQDLREGLVSEMNK